MKQRKIKRIFKGKLLDVITKKTRFPNGYETTLEIVKHPGAALVVPFLANDKIIMLRQFRPVINSYIYELPAGTITKGESSLSCARREITEETGYTAKKITKVGEIYPAPGYTTEKIIIYKAEGLEKGPRLAEEDEIIKIHIFSRRKIRELFRNNRIVDAKTISALSLCSLV